MAGLLALDFGGTKHTAGFVSLPPSGALSAVEAPVPGARSAVEAPAPGALSAVEAPVPGALSAVEAPVPGILKWTRHARQMSPAHPSAASDLHIMLELARQVLQGEQPEAIGVSFGGPVDSQAGRVRLSHHVPGWEDAPLAQRLQAEFGCPVLVDNDANVAALGEFRFGAGRGCHSLMYITVSTGVGGGWILEGKIWHGADGMAGEIGHTIVDPNGPRCLCGKRGCLERLASGPYLAEDARQRLRSQPESGARLVELAGGDLESISGKLVAQAAALGDPLALELLDRAAWALGTGIGNAANLVNPGRFILGGGVTQSGERFWSGVRSAAHQTALPEVNFEILPAELGDDAPLWGAVALAETCRSRPC
jgi:glucokinase